MKPVTRRQTLLTALFGTGYVGLRALATGLPAWFVSKPTAASADELACAIDAKENLQYLVVSAPRARATSISCNCPGTYDASAVIHPAQAEFAATSFSLGDKTVNAAQVWSTLTPAVLARTNFLPPRHGRHRPRRPAEGHALARQARRQRDVAPPSTHQAPRAVLRHRSSRAACSRDRRQCARAALLHGPHVTRRRADAAEAALDRLHQGSGRQAARAQGFGHSISSISSPKPPARPSSSVSSTRSRSAKTKSGSSPRRSRRRSIRSRTTTSVAKRSPPRR